MACVTGIMILVTLIMALDPMGEVPSQTRKPEEADNQHAQLARAQAFGRSSPSSVRCETASE